MQSDRLWVSLFDFLIPRFIWDPKPDIKFAMFHGFLKIESVLARCLIIYLAVIIANYERRILIHSELLTAPGTIFPFIHMPAPDTIVCQSKKPSGYSSVNVTRIWPQSRHHSLSESPIRRLCGQSVNREDPRDDASRAESSTCGNDHTNRRTPHIRGSC